MPGLAVRYALPGTPNGATALVLNDVTMAGATGVFVSGAGDAQHGIALLDLNSWQTVAFITEYQLDTSALAGGGHAFIT